MHTCLYICIYIGADLYFGQLPLSFAACVGRVNICNSIKQAYIEGHVQLEPSARVSIAKASKSDRTGGSNFNSARSSGQTAPSTPTSTAEGTHCSRQDSARHRLRLVDANLGGTIDTKDHLYASASPTAMQHRRAMHTKQTSSMGENKIRRSNATILKDAFWLEFVNRQDNLGNTAM